MTQIADQLELFAPPTDEELNAYLAAVADDSLDKEYASLAQTIREEKEDTMGQFKGWGSTPRWHKGLTITEKIDGTNACVVIYNGEVKAQSRKRMITPDDDNMGFAKWVYDNAGALMDTLGYGYHYGEWFGPGIQKNPLGVESKRFALFHATKYTEANGYELNKVGGLETVPLLFHGQGSVETIPNVVDGLAMMGSQVRGAKHVTTTNAWGEQWTRPADSEGIIIWHKETQQRYKILLKDDAFHKWEVK